MHWADLSSDTKCWNRAADAQRAHHTPQAVGPPHTSPNTQQRVLGLLGRHSPQKSSPLRGCTLNFINHTCPPTTHNVGLFPTITHANRSDIVDGWPAGVYQGARARRRRPTVTTDRPSRAAWRGLIDGVVSVR